MESKKLTFKKQLNGPLTFFTVFYAIYFGIQIYDKNYQAALVILGLAVLVYFYFLCWRPSGYEIEKKTLTLKRRLLKDKEINIMEMETITNPIPKMSKIIANSHSYEIYMNGGDRITVAPQQDRQLEFVDAIMHANKRIHCQVKEYNESHRVSQKKRRRNRDKEEQE